MENTCRECGAVVNLANEEKRQFESAKLDEVLKYYCFDCGTSVILSLLFQLPINPTMTIEK